MDNPERAEGEGRAQHTGKKILANLAGSITRNNEIEEPQPTFQERVARTPEQLELIPGYREIGICSGWPWRKSTPWVLSS